MTRRVELVLLCEDTQHEAFLRRFLTAMGWPMRRLRVEKAPAAGGSAEQFVRERFPIELDAYRRRRGQVGIALAVMQDGDAHGRAGRLGAFAEACKAAEIPARQADDRVAIFVPTWNIESWLAYFDGTNVDETKRDYPRLQRERDCGAHVDRLVAMCRGQGLRQPAPDSLTAACDEYRTRLERR